ncbi:hypothetical protein [Curtobacterium sp. MCLR17_054]|uniref:hypothetical protein n=1 Tax=Curtobacterium sp. MCLR17_054 TaxID=2175632 RepID=UPI000DAA9965|nr:hypothetical protein [Curtobacterium sp. MCLR17_054]WIE69547.1 hypothetical protein DEJ08_006135 [Curtobacterium sp. MCLR17_054]
MSAALTVELLRTFGVALEPGLTERELARAERRYGVRFGADHRALLSLALPSGDGWFDWRARNDERLRRAIRWPVEGALFDVRHDAFWPGSWGERPGDESQRLEAAARHLRQWPQLVPLYSHRYLPAAPLGSGAPVFSVHQTDVVIYGDDLVDYVKREFRPDRTERETSVGMHDLEPWTLLAFGEDVP